MEKDIYDVNIELIQTLTVQQEIRPISYEFIKYNSNALRVKYVERIMLKYNQIPDLELQRPKSSEKAVAVRQNGNRLFMLKGANLFKALELYNQSICLAERASPEFSIGLANRSAVYFELRLTQPCLNNIRYAKLAGYPERLLDKLAKREMECRALELEIKSKPEPEGALIPSSIALTSIALQAFRSDHLELRETPEFGRHVVTKTRLNPGFPMAYEEPFANVLLPALRYQRCWNCMVELNMDLLPCMCCTSVMFCSPKCLDTANSTYHPYECPIIDYLLALFNKIHLLALRTTIMGILAFGSLELLDNFLIAHGDENVNVFNRPASTVGADGAYENDAQRKFHQIHSLQTNQEKRDNSDLFQRATIAAVLYHKLMKHTPLSKECKNERLQNRFIDLLYRFLQTGPTNFHSLSFVDNADDMGDTQYGAAAYPFASLINHSCAPNIIRVAHKQDMFIIALRVIHPGEQLFDNYGFHHCLQSVQMRRKSLQLQYNFVCRCVACVEDYPPYANLRSANIPEGVSEKIYERLKDSVTTNEELEEMVQYLEKYDNEYPCSQISNAQECMKISVHVLTQNVPMALLIR